MKLCAMSFQMISIKTPMFLHGMREVSLKMQQVACVDVLLFAKGVSGVSPQLLKGAVKISLYFRSSWLPSSCTSSITPSCIGTLWHCLC